MKQTLHLTYDCLPFVEDLVKELRREIFALGDIADGTIDDSGKNYRVHLAEFSETSIDIELEIHVNGGDGNNYRARRQEILVKIAEIVQRRGAKFCVLNGLMAKPYVDLAAGKEQGPS